MLSTDFTLNNIRRIPRLQDLFDKYGMLPTYLVTYPVASDEESVKILRGNPGGRSL